MAIKGFVPHKGLLVFKKGICKHSDAERVRLHSLDNLELLLTAVCEDWGIPVIHATFVSRPCSGYLGRYTYQSPTRLFPEFHKIEINSPAYARFVQDSATPFFKRADLIDTILHEIAHYIEMVMYKSTGHSSRFWEILSTLKANNYTDKLVEVE